MAIHQTTTYADYSWVPNDDPAVTAGADSEVQWAGQIAKDDAYGGCITQWALGPGRQDFYHVHFIRNSRKVTVVRYFQQSGTEGRNILRLIADGKQAKNLRDLARLCVQADPPYDRFAALLTKLRLLVPEDFKCGA
jgi:hypothetical protein